MSDSPASSSASKPFLFAGLIGLALWGAYSLGTRNRAETANARAKADMARTDGVGIVTEAPEIKAAPKQTAVEKTAQKSEPTAPVPPSSPVAAPVAEQKVNTPAGPAKFVIRTSPLATITIIPVEGPKRTGRTDAAGVYRTEMLPPGAYSASIEHPDFLKLDPAREFTMTAGETTDLTIALRPKPASLMILADDRSEVFVDGRRSGSGGAVMIGEAPSGRALAVRVVNPSGPVEKTVTLVAKETRILDCRTPAPAPKAVVKTEKPSSDLPPESPPVKSAVKIISVNPESKIIALSLDPSASAPPLAKGATGFLIPAPGKPAVAVKCVSTFANVSVCETPGVAGVSAPAVGELTH